MKSLVFMQGNPVHCGHIALFEAALDYSETLDVFVSQKRQRPRDLPHEVRRNAVITAIQNYQWNDRVSVLDNELIKGGLFSIRAEVYGLLAIGSDIARHLASSTSILTARETEYFLSYPNLLILQRPSYLLVEEEQKILRTRVQKLILCPPKIAYSASDIRKDFRQGKDISMMLPPNVWGQIEPHVDCFNAPD